MIDNSKKITPDCLQAAFELIVNYVNENKSVPNENYSSEEQEIGTWVNGKKLYQKTLSQATTGSEAVTIPHGITNCDMIFIYNAFASFSDGHTESSLIAYTENANRENIELGTLPYDDTYSYTVFVTIRYTKTT